MSFQEWHGPGPGPSSVFDFLVDHTQPALIPRPQASPRRLRAVGGILAPELGLGKTLTALALVLAHPAPTRDEKTDDIKNTDGCRKNVIRSRATVIAAAPECLEHWSSCIARWTDPSRFRAVRVTNKTEHGRLTYRDVVHADVVLMSTEFLDTSYWNTCCKAPTDAVFDLLAKDLARLLNALAPNFRVFSFRRGCVEISSFFYHAHSDRR